MADVDLTKLTISELAPRIRAREVSPVEVTEAALAQVDRLQPRLNSFITILHDQALSRARKLEAELARGEYRGPLHGIPIGVKDNIATGGVRSTVGSKILADHVPNEDAHTVGLCIQAGAILLGKEKPGGVPLQAESPPTTPTTGRFTTPGTWTASPAAPAEGVRPTWRRVSPSHRLAPTLEGRYVSRALSVAS